MRTGTPLRGAEVGAGQHASMRPARCGPERGVDATTGSTGSRRPSFNEAGPMRTGTLLRRVNNGETMGDKLQ